MTLTLPDDPALDSITGDEMLLELACALYARGRLGKVRGAALAGVDFVAFQGALSERGLIYSSEMLDDDLATINHLWPR